MNAAVLDLLDRRNRLRRARSSGLTRPGAALVEVAGATIRIRDVGPKSAARTVVLAPDPPNVLEHYDALIACLEKRYRVVGFELPGFGFSVAPRGFGFSIDEYVDLAAALFSELDLDRAVWTSSCLPSYVGLRMAARHPATLSAMVCGQAPSWEEELRWANRIDAPRILSRSAVGQLFMRVASQRVAAGWYDAAALPSQREWMATIALDALGRGAAYSLASLFQRFLSGAHPLGPVDLPSVFVWGGLDRTHRKTDRRSVRENASDAKIVEFPGCAHFPDVEEPDLFADLIDELAHPL